MTLTITETMPAIEGVHEYAAACERARRMFKTLEMQEAGKFMAVVHPRAIDYLEQAPVLAIAVRWGGGLINGGHGGAALYAAHKIHRLCERGARLRDVMAAYQLPVPLRKLKAKALALSDQPGLTEITRLAPSTIAQTIPGSIVAQRRWLGAIVSWHSNLRNWRMSDRYRGWTDWFIVQSARYEVQASEAHTVGDFFARGDVPFNPRWSWPRAMAAADDWHDRLSAGSAEKLFGVMAGAVVDLGEHPDRLVIDDLEFIALRTPIAIHAEGRAMRHCVSSYVPSVVNGHCHIGSIRSDERRIATLELEQKSLAVRQCKGRFNRTPGPEVMRAARQYAADLRRVRASKAAKA